MQEICGENLRKITNREAVNDEHTISPAPSLL